MGKKKYDPYGGGGGACHKVFSKIKAESFPKHIQLEEFHKSQNKPNPYLQANAITRNKCTGDLHEGD